MARLSVRQAAEYIPLAVGTLNKLRVSGEGPTFIKLGAKVLYDTVDLTPGWTPANADPPPSPAADREAACTRRAPGTMHPCVPG
jgi:hypothetical protein